MKIKTLNSRCASLVLLVSLMIAYTFMCMTRNCFSSAMVFIVDEGLLTKFQTGIITAAFYVVYAGLQIVGGFVTDKLSPERFVTIGLVGAAVSNLVIFFNQNYIVMLLAWSFNAAMQFGVWPAVFKIVSTMLVPKMRDTSLFVATLASPAGVALSYVVAAIVGKYWQLNFIISTIGLLAFAFSWEITVMLLKPYMQTAELGATEKSVIREKKDVNFGKLMLRSGLVVVLVIAFIRTMFDFGIKGLTPTMINESYESVSPVLATVMNIVVLIAGVLGIIIAYVIYPRYVKNESAVVAVFFGLAMPLSIVPLWLGSINYWLMVVALALIVMLMGGSTLFTTTYMAARFNKYGKGATVAGIMNCTSSLGIVLAHTLFPAIADATGWRGTVILWIAMMAAAVVCTVIHLPIWTKFLKSRA